jgi:Zn-dependent alcohol dehydrogenase
VNGSQVVPIAAGVPLESACLLACAVATGVGAVRNTAQVPSGTSVAVVGSGGVGLNSIQGAALAGSHPVIAIDVSDSKLCAARLFGATDVINSRRVDAREAVRSLTAGRGVDFTFITSGSPPAIELGLGLSRRAGTVVRPHIDLPALVELYCTGRLRLDALVTHRFPLDRINDALSTARRGEGLRSVIVF